MKADVVVVGAGLAGLVAAAEAADRGRRVLLLDQEGPQSLGGQAHWSFGGLFLVDSPEQRRLRVRDSVELAWSDWEATAGFDRPEDHWPRQWARAYVDFAAGEKRSWLAAMGHRLFPVVGWAERGGWSATGPGNSVPRFHITWGTGPGLVEPFERRVREHEAAGRLTYLARHRVDGLLRDGTAVTGVHGSVLAPDDAPRGIATSREAVGEFTAEGAVVMTTGGVGGNHDLVRRYWPARLGDPPQHMVAGVPAHVDGRGIALTEAAGGNVINKDRMWHYVEGLHNWAPVWAGHGIRILPGPSSVWLDATGCRLPAPLYPGFDTLGTLEHLRRTGHDHSWFVATREIVGKEYVLSGSEQNLDLTDRDWRAVARRATADVSPSVQAFLDHGADFVQAPDLDTLVERMNALTPEPLLDPALVRREVEARDAQIANAYGKDPQVTAIHGARRYLGDRLVRTCPPHRLLDPAHGPLVGIRLSILTRKTLGGLETTLSGQVLAPGGAPIDGLYAAGEAAGFGGGGMHGYRSLEGTFLGGCLFSGRTVGLCV